MIGEFEVVLSRWHELLDSKNVGIFFSNDIGTFENCLKMVEYESESQLEEY